MLLLNYPMVLNGILKYHRNTTEVTFIVAQYVKIPLIEQPKQDGIIEWSDLLLKGMFQYRCEYH